MFSQERQQRSVYYQDISTEENLDQRTRKTGNRKDSQIRENRVGKESKVQNSKLSSTTTSSQDSIIVKKLKNAKQQCLNTQEHVLSLREEINRHRKRMENSLTATHELLKSEIEKSFLDSIRQLSIIEQKLLEPVNEQVAEINKKANEIQSLIDNLSSLTPDDAQSIDKANKLLHNYTYDVKVSVPDFSQLTNRKSFPLCSMTIAYNNLSTCSFVEESKMAMNCCEKDPDELSEKRVLKQINGIENYIRKYEKHETSDPKEFEILDLSSSFSSDEESLRSPETERLENHRMKKKLVNQQKLNIRNKNNKKNSTSIHFKSSSLKGNKYQMVDHVSSAETVGVSDAFKELKNIYLKFKKDAVGIQKR
jgi:hypothetical protein